MGPTLGPQFFLIECRLQQLRGFLHIDRTRYKAPPTGRQAKKPTPPGFKRRSPRHAFGGNSEATPQDGKQTKTTTLRNPQNFGYEVSHLRGHANTMSSKLKAWSSTTNAPNSGPLSLRNCSGTPQRAMVLISAAQCGGHLGIRCISDPSWSTFAPNDIRSMTPP